MRTWRVRAVSYTHLDVYKRQVDSCLTEDETADAIIVSIRKLLKAFKLTAYDEVAGRGFLRHVLVKRGFCTGEIMVVLVTGRCV